MIHYCILFFKNTLSIPKIKDFIDLPNKKYEKMLNIIQKEKQTIDEGTFIDLLPSEPTFVVNEEVMKQELKNFLKFEL